MPICVFTNLQKNDGLGKLKKFAISTMFKFECFSFNLISWIACSLMICNGGFPVVRLMTSLRCLDV